MIVPLMQHDAVATYHWMTGSQFLNAVALGQITPGPVVQTVAVVGYAAGGSAGTARRVSLSRRLSYSSFSAAHYSTRSGATKRSSHFSPEPDHRLSAPLQDRRSLSVSRFSILAGSGTRRCSALAFRRPARRRKWAAPRRSNRRHHSARRCARLRRAIKDSRAADKWAA